MGRKDFKEIERICRKKAEKEEKMIDKYLLQLYSMKWLARANLIAATNLVAV